MKVTAKTITSTRSKLFGAVFIVLSSVFGALFSTSAYAEITHITNAELAAMEPGSVTILDLRRPDEWTKSGTIEGSHLVTFFDKRGRYNVQEWLAKVDAIVDRDQPIALICERGVRSSSVADLLDKKLGFTQVINVTEGMTDWVKDGRPVEPWAAE